MKRKIFFAIILSIVLTPQVIFTAEIFEFNKYYEESLNRGLKNIDPYIYYLINKPELCPLECLKNLSGYSFDTPPLYLRLSEEYFSQPQRNGLLSGTDSFLRFIQSIKGSTIWKAQIIHTFTACIIFAFLATSLLFVILRARLDLPLYLHEIKEKKSNLIRISILLIPSLYGLPYLAGALLLLYAEKSSRSHRLFFIFYLIILLLLPFLIRYERILFSLYSDNVIRAVVEVNEGRDNTRAIVFLRDVKDNDWRLKFSYALALKREGRLKEAFSIFKELSGLKNDYRILNNIGNCLFLENKINDAIEYYTKSSELKNRASSLFNLSQAYKELLEFQKGTDYYQKAISLDSELISWFTKINARQINRFLIDETLDQSTLWELAIKIAKASEKSTIRFLEILLPLIMGIIFFIKPAVSAYRCSKCGKIICNICQKKRLWGMMCADCHDVFVAPMMTDSKTRLERILSLQRKMENRRRVFTIFLILPGFVEFYTGRIISGFAIGLLFFFSIGLMILSGIYTIETFRQPYLLWFGIVLFMVILFIHFITSWRLKRWV